ncbi:MAG: hypothetical protein R3B95_02910 [Nitrospirales bacterium]|nr:hypothetical protein [Nitrospirales bacterium]
MSTDNLQGCRKGIAFRCTWLLGWAHILRGALVLSPSALLQIDFVEWVRMIMQGIRWMPDD